MNTDLSRAAATVVLYVLIIIVVGIAFSLGKFVHFLYVYLRDKQKNTHREKLIKSGNNMTCELCGNWQTIISISNPNIAYYKSRCSCGRLKVIMR